MPLVVCCILTNALCSTFPQGEHRFAVAALQPANYPLDMGIPGNMVREMTDEVLEFTRTYTVWRELMDPSRFSARINHEDFLLTVQTSLLSPICVRTFQLFDHDPKTKSLRTLIKDVRSSDPQLALELERSIKGQQAVIDKFCRLRHNVYAHRNKQQTPRDVFADVKLTPKMMNGMVQLAQDVVLRLAVFVGVGKEKELQKEFCDHQQRVLADTRAVLDALQ